jgi:hypothetical protein
LPAQIAPSGHAAHRNGALALGAQKPGLHWHALFEAAVSVPMYRALFAAHGWHEACPGAS